MSSNPINRAIDGLVNGYVIGGMIFCLILLGIAVWKLKEAIP